MPDPRPLSEQQRRKGRNTLLSLGNVVVDKVGEVGNAGVVDKEVDVANVGQGRLNVLQLVNIERNGDDVLVLGGVG